MDTNAAAELLPLTGFTVAVTAARRREELSGLLARRGARVVEAPAIRIVPTGDDEELLASTRACLATAPDVVVATTGIGFRGWMEAADGWGLGAQLRERIGAAELLARGPKVKGAVRAAGLTETWSPESEASDEVLARLLAQGVAGRTVVVQLHGEPVPGFLGALRDAGARVLEVPVYRWVPAEDLAPLRRLVAALATAAVDCVTFTSAPAVASLLATADEEGRRDEVLAALSGPVVTACVGPVTAAPLERLGVPTVQPERARLGALVRTVVEQVPLRRSRTLLAGGQRLELRGSAVLVDARPVALPADQVAVLAALVDAAGGVLSRQELLGRAWPSQGVDEQAVDTAVQRLRSALGPAGDAVQTEGERGYRLAAPLVPRT